MSDNKLVSVRSQSLIEINAYGEDCSNVLFFVCVNCYTFYGENKLYTYKMIKY